MNTELLTALTKHFIGKGADGFYVGGTTGEGICLRTEERMTLAEAAIDAAKGRVPCILHVAADFSINVDFAAKMFQIDNTTAIKRTSPDYYGIIRLTELTHGKMNIINGPDEMLLMGLSVGAVGGIGTTYNFMLERYLNI